MIENSQTSFEWVAFYMEFADKLLPFNKNRAELLSILEVAHKKAGVRYPFIEKGQPINDICPFTVFGAFNKGITDQNRIALASEIAKQLDVRATVPLRFEGIPVLNNMQSWFFWGIDDRKPEDINNLWGIFEDAITFADDSSDRNRENFILSYNRVTAQNGIKWNITMGLYWIRPLFYLNLDSRNRQFLLENEKTRTIGIGNISDLKQLPNAESYLNMTGQCKRSFTHYGAAFSSFPELSKAAWLTTLAEASEKENKVSEASFLQWFEPLLTALKDLGGSATPDIVRSQIIINLDLSDDEINKTRGRTEHKKFDNEVAWARNYLAYDGYIDKSVRGVWALTEKGSTATMTHELASEIFKKWVEILKNRRESKVDETGDRRDTPEKRFWIYAPGEGSRKWDEFYTQGLMGIGWDDLGDLNQYPDREAMRKKMKEVYDETRSYTMSALATWQFAHTIREGDVIFAKKGMREIVGRGVVESEYIYMPERNEYMHIRKVKWTHNGSWEHPGQAVMKTLTDITPYTEYVEKLELLLAGDSDLEDIEPDVELSYEKYTEDDFLGEVFLEPEQYETLLSLIKNKRNLILQGAPGVGKTFAAKRLAHSIIGEKDTKRVMMVQFHQSYSYEDFIMGFRPAEDGFELAEGPFYRFCKNAENDVDRDYFFIIDEINRGNLSKIFGELLMLIENDKRGEKLRLLYSNELFSVPGNVHIIGLMNTADRSLAMIDYALRRRFAFYEMEPAFDSTGFQAIVELSGNIKLSKLIKRVKDLNELISKDESLGDGFRIGHSYFCTDSEITDIWLTSVVNFEILPLLSEYWFDEKSKVEDWTRRLRGALND